MATEVRSAVNIGVGPMEMDISDQDGEFEEDYETPQAHPATPGDTQSRDGQQEVDVDAEGESEDAEGESEDAEGEDEDDGEAPGAVKIRDRILGESDSGDEDENNHAAFDSDPESKSAGSGDDSGADSETAESEAEEEWDAHSESTKDAQEGDPDVKFCIHCRQSEEDDPAEEFEEPLSCAVCGDIAHRQCARDANYFSGDEDPESWRCLSCVEDNANPRDESIEQETPKLLRDLGAAAGRGDLDPPPPSIFKELILADDPLDGSRSLRKRKTTPDEDEDDSAPATRTTRKRRRTSTVASGSARQASAPTTPRTRSGATAADEVSDQNDGTSPRTRSTRPRRSISNKHKPGASIISVEGMAMVVCIRVADKDRLAKILAARPRKKKLRTDRPPKAQPAYIEPEISHYPAIDTNYQPFIPYGEREDDPSKTKPYGGILNEIEADTSKTFPVSVDRRRFEDARLKAEEDWKRKIAAAAAAGPPEPVRPVNKMSGPPSKIKCINFGGYEIDTWHAAPYPEEYSRNKVLYICEFCLKYMNSDYVAWRHKLKCAAKHPPGDEIYRDGKFSFFEVDGRKNPVYCQNLCLLAKLFLGSKTLYYDVEPFLFYIMTENDEFGCHFVGYFSKEKRPSSLNNVSCILVLPIHQRKGFGHMLIEFSYLLTRQEKKTGSPEKPLSDMGLVSYRSYWRLIMCYQLRELEGAVSITQLSERTGMTGDDIVSALEGLRALVRDPITKTYAFRLDLGYFDQFIKKFESKNWPKIEPKSLIWTPFEIGRGNLSHYDDGPQLHTVAPREEETNEDAVAEEGVQMEEAVATSQDPAELCNSDTAIPDVAPPAQTTTINHHPPIVPSTPLSNGIPHTPIPGPSMSTPSFPSTHIPPNRYEVFPPIPGMPATKRRPGRPFGSRRRPQTPLRRNHTAPSGGKNLQLLARSHSGKSSPIGNPIGLGINGSTVRRTRSKLGELVNGNGTNVDEVAGSGSPRKSLRRLKELAKSEMGGGESNGGDDDDAEAEDDGEGDEDAEGEEEMHDEAMAD
ncbi:hypothetical protein EJ05DRAFT_513803 [Pseudovirgaria hyperparasitica]|uniref:Histone acetyltransferase n=1 Tax=Pseudovirgaria hyperparasitica TaxID=470096 RepID=A0A6A6VYI0_9PEZI|nr:uncharacterized protein EJ05DRAFT_513803 [Pseudovirgaria hyperparasitica]KAF2754886.1 hypothetical protein EJ05DRAFT_513803 [Pseudovirgaria hyperparasitica]